MASRLWIGIWIGLLALTPVVFAQDNEDDGGIEIGNEGDAVPEDEPEADRPRKRPDRAAGKRKPGEKHKRVAVVGKKGVYTFKLPDDWVVTPVEAEGTAATSFELRLPGSRGIARLHVYRHKNMGHPRGVPFRWTARKGETQERFVAPLPHVITRFQRNGNDVVAADVFRRVRGNLLQVNLVCLADDFVDARQDLLDATRSLTAKLDTWPPTPSGYKTRTKGRYRYVVHPGIKSYSHVERTISRQAKAFAKFHGALPKAVKGEYETIYVIPTLSAAKDISEQAAKSTNSTYVDVALPAVFTTPIAKTNLQRTTELAGTTQGLLFVLRYGSHTPLWAWTGERGFTNATLMTGKKLPYLHEGYSSWAAQLALKPLDVIDAYQKENSSDFFQQSFWYVALFRAGPSKYRKAYKAFLKDYAQTGDGEAALKKHIEPLGYGEIKAAATKFAYSVKFIKPK